MQKKLKIALTIHDAQFGGAPKQVFWTLQALNASGCETLLVSNSKNTWLAAQLEKYCPETKLIYSPWIQRAFDPFREIAATWQLYCAFKNERPDVVLLGGAKLIVQGGIAAILSGVPERYVRVHGMGAPADSRMAQASLRFFKCLAKLNFKFITVSEFDKRLLITNGLPPKKITAVYNGTDTDIINAASRGVFRSAQDIPPDALVVGMVGRLADQKSCPDFITAMSVICAEFENVYGLLVGDGPLRDELQVQINATGYAERIRLTGYVADVANVYADLDISVLLTRFEGLSNTLLESAAMGLPVIASNVCSNGEIIQTEQTGYLVENQQQVVSALRSLLTSDEKRKMLGQNAQQIILEKYDKRKQVVGIVNLLTGSFK